MDIEIVEQTLEALRHTKPFNVLVGTFSSSSPRSQLWKAVNNANLAFRLPLYHRYLGKAVPKKAVCDQAVQNGLAILAAFAQAVGTKQVVVSSHGGVVDSISFQPRPFEYTWTTRHGMSPLEDSKGEVGIDDMLFMAAKTACAAGHYQWLHMPDTTTTFLFYEGVLIGKDSAYWIQKAGVVVREAITNAEHHVVLH